MGENDTGETPWQRRGTGLRVQAGAIEKEIECPAEPRERHEISEAACRGRVTGGHGLRGVGVHVPAYAELGSHGRRGGLENQPLDGGV
jgi:hypothetical protein